MKQLGWIVRFLIILHRIQPRVRIWANAVTGSESREFLYLGTAQCEKFITDKEVWTRVIQKAAKEAGPFPYLSHGAR